jgi:hypothetical protein
MMNAGIMMAVTVVGGGVLNETRLD